MTSSPVPLDVPAALTELGIEYNITGNEAKALCPAPDHDDTTPSWSINLDSGQHNCFSCGFGGGFVYLTMIVRDQDGKAAKEWVRQRKVKDIAAGAERKAARQEHAELTEADLWEFDDDYPQDELDYRGFSEYEAQGFNLLWDHKRDGWVIPVRDLEYKLIGYQFKPRHGTDGIPINYPKYLKKSGRLFDGLQEMEGDVLIIVESPLDVVRLWHWGHENVVALYGSSLDLEQAELIMERFDRVILALDDDEAGRKGISKALSRLKGVQCYVFAYGDVKRAGPYHVHGTITEKDPGDLTKAEFARGLSRATPGFMTGFE